MGGTPKPLLITPAHTAVMRFSARGNAHAPAAIAKDRSTRESLSLAVPLFNCVGDLFSRSLSLMGIRAFSFACFIK